MSAPLPPLIDRIEQLVFDHRYAEAAALCREALRVRPGDARLKILLLEAEPRARHAGQIVQAPAQTEQTEVIAERRWQREPARTPRLGLYLGILCAVALVAAALWRLAQASRQASATVAAGTATSSWDGAPAPDAGVSGQEKAPPPSPANEPVAEAPPADSPSGRATERPVAYATNRPDARPADLPPADSPSGRATERPVAYATNPSNARAADSPSTRAADSPTADSPSARATNSPVAYATNRPDARPANSPSPANSPNEANSPSPANSPNAALQPALALSPAPAAPAAEALLHDTWIHPLPGPERRMPLRDSRVFGAERLGHRPSECRGGHCGVDLGGAIAYGEPVLAVHDGVVDRVVRAANDDHGGHYVRLAHRGATVFSQYFHLAAIPRHLRPGVAVAVGDVIGWVGDSGIKRSRPHLHFTVSVRAGRDDERYLDPEPLIALWPLRVLAADGHAAISTEIAVGATRGFAHARGRKRRG